MNRIYFEVITNSLLGKPLENTGRKHEARKNALVALANLSDAFQRMLSEPKSQQQAVTVLKKFLVLNHMLTSHVATLASYRQIGLTAHDNPELLPVQQDIILILRNCLEILTGSGQELVQPQNKSMLVSANEKSRRLLDIRKMELESGFLETQTRKELLNHKSIVDQFNIIYKIVGDLGKVTAETAKQV